MLFIPYLKSSGKIKGCYMLTPTPQDLSVFGDGWEDYALIFDYVHIKILDKDGKEDTEAEQKIYNDMENYYIDVNTKKLVKIQNEEITLEDFVQEGV